MDIQEAIQRLEEMKDYLKCEALEVDVIDLAIKALEEKYFFENEVSRMQNWFIDNKDCLLDSAMSILRNWLDDCNVGGKMDEVDLDFMIEELVDEIQKGIFNVLDSYR